MSAVPHKEVVIVTGTTVKAPERFKLRGSLIGYLPPRLGQPLIILSKEHAGGGARHFSFFLISPCVPPYSGAFFLADQRGIVSFPKNLRFHQQQCY